MGHVSGGAMRLGFPVSVLGRPRLKSHDSRRWQNNPHLSVSLLYLRDIFEYLNEQDIRMYRISSQLAPYYSHPDMRHFRRQIDESVKELEHLGRSARRYNLRLSFHALPFTSLGARDPRILESSLSDLEGLSRMLDGLGCGPEAVVIMHLGGHYGDPAGSKALFAERFQALPPAVQRRLALENDERYYSLGDVLEAAYQIGVPVVFDYLHFSLLNPEGWSVQEALQRALETWPAGVRPKIHFSSPRTEMRHTKRAGESQGLSAPPPNAHADFINPFEFISFAGMIPAGQPLDIMLEAKAKDLAVLRLRADLERYAPELAVRFE